MGVMHYNYLNRYEGALIMNIKYHHLNCRDDSFDVGDSVYIIDVKNTSSGEEYHSISHSEPKPIHIMTARRNGSSGFLGEDCNISKWWNGTGTVTRVFKNGNILVRSN